MRSFSLIIHLLLILLFSLRVSGEVLEETKFTAQKRAVFCGSLIDGINNDIKKNQLITIVNDKIVSVEHYKKRNIQDNSQILDLSEYHCLPGLIDTHTHITEKAGDTADLSVYYTMTEEEVIEISNKNAETTLNAGFTAVRNVGSYIAWSALNLRNRINNGEVIGPRIQQAGFYLTVPGGGGDLLIPGFPEGDIPPHVRMGVSYDAEEFRNNAKKAIDGGADFLKILASGAVLAFDGIPGAPEMTPEEITAVVSVAKEAGVKVTSHAHGAQSIKDSILAGVNSIEHASLADQEAIDLAAERGVVFSMDVYNGSHAKAVGEEQGWPEEFMRKMNETTDAQRQVFRKAVKAGVPITFGTDAAVYPHGENAKQFSIMIEFGMTPMQAIKSATSVAAKYMGWGEEIGSVRKGYYADIIATKKNPLENISVLENIDFVMKGGEVIKNVN